MSRKQAPRPPTPEETQRAEMRSEEGETYGDPCRAPGSLSTGLLLYFPFWSCQASGASESTTTVFHLVFPFSAPPPPSRIPPHLEATPKATLPPGPLRVLTPFPLDASHLEAVSIQKGTRSIPSNSEFHLIPSRTCVCIVLQLESQGWNGPWSA